MVKFGVMVRTCDTLPAPNFVKNHSEICLLEENFCQKFEIFTIFSYLRPHYFMYTDNVKFLL